MFFAFFAQAALLLAAPTNSALYPIDPSQRGSDLISLFNQLSVSPYRTYQSEIALQTTDELIHYVQSITSASNSTIFAVNFYPVITNGGVPVKETIQETRVVFVEKISQMVYSNGPIIGTSYTPNTVPMVIPYFPMNSLQRGTDIQYMVALLKNSSQQARVTLTTTLTGARYEAIPDGVIPDVQNVTILLNTQLLVAYNRPYAYVIVAPDQVLSINYIGPAI